MDIFKYGINFLIILFSIATIALIIILWFVYKKPKSLIKTWNKVIEKDCIKQDDNSYNGIRSYSDAWNSEHEEINHLHHLISLYDEDIKLELENFKLIAGDNDKIWIKMYNNWSKISVDFPTLKYIASRVPMVNSLSIYTLNPGESFVNKFGSSYATLRYQYNLKISSGNVGGKIDGYDIHFEEGTGFVWNDNLQHYYWNHTSTPTIIIFAEIFRKLPFAKNIGTKMLYKLLRKNHKLLNVANSDSETTI